MKQNRLSDTETYIMILWQAAMDHLENLFQRVQEGRDIDAACEFAKFISNSGVIRLCELNPVQGLAKVDGRALREKTRAVMEACQERYRARARGDLSTGMGRDYIETLNSKLDQVLALLGAHAAPSPPAPEQSQAPKLANAPRVKTFVGASVDIDAYAQLASAASDNCRSIAGELRARLHDAAREAAAN